MASKFVVDVQSVVSREKDPFQFGVFSVGSFQAGSAGNIIPDSATLRGTIRTYDKNVRTKLQDGIRRTAKAVAAMSGAPEPQLKIESGGEAVINDVSLVEKTEAVFKTAFGAKARRAQGSDSLKFRAAPRPAARQLDRLRHCRELPDHQTH